MKKVVLVSRVKWGLEALKIMHSFSPELDIRAVITLPNEESQRHSNYAPFDDICRDYGIPLIKTMNINNEAGRLRDLNIDYLLILGWSQLIRKEILEAPALGCIGTHPAHLPKDRGRAPVTWQLIKGYHRSALTFFFIDEGTDSGDIIMQRSIDLTLEDTAETFYGKMISTGLQILKEIIPLLLQDQLPRRKQNHDHATYLARRRPEDGIIDWNKSSFEIYNWIRGLTRPFPGAFTSFNGKKVFIWRSIVERYTDEDVSPGLVVNIDEEGILVETGKGRLYLNLIQFEGEENLSDFNDGRLNFLKGKLLGT